MTLRDRSHKKADDIMTLRDRSHKKADDIMTLRDRSHKKADDIMTLRDRSHKKAEDIMTLRDRSHKKADDIMTLRKRTNRQNKLMVVQNKQYTKSGTQLNSIPCCSVVSSIYFQSWPLLCFRIFNAKHNNIMQLVVIVLSPIVIL
jgi:hypothetical protein